MADKLVMVCSSCGTILNRYTLYHDGSSDSGWRHPEREKGFDHEPVPAPAPFGSGNLICDFCSDPNPVNVFIPQEGTVTQAYYDPIQDAHVVRDMSNSWSACQDCSDLVEAKRLPQLITRVMELTPSKKVTRGMLYTLYGDFFKTKPIGPLPLMAAEFEE